MILIVMKTLDILMLRKNMINIKAVSYTHLISIEDFQTRCKVSQTLIEKMRSMGIFSGMPETSQLSLF